MKKALKENSRIACHSAAHADGLNHQVRRLLANDGADRGPRQFLVGPNGWVFYQLASIIFAGWNDDQIP